MIWMFGKPRKTLTNEYLGSSIINGRPLLYLTRTAVSHWFQTPKGHIFVWLIQSIQYNKVIITTKRETLLWCPRSDLRDKELDSM